MISAEGFLTDSQSAFEEWLGFCVLALRFVESCQIVETCGGIRMISAKGFLANGESAFVERFGLGVLAL